MRFWILFKESMRFVVRSRLLFLIILFSCFLHYVSLSLTQHATVSVQGFISNIGPRQGMFVSVFISLFMGMFLSAIYGIWMLPYLHQGERSLLTFVLPVSKWLYPLVYGLSFLLLMLIEFGILVGSFGIVFGREALADPRFSWHALIICGLICLLATQVFLFLFGFLSLVLGHMMTLFVSAGAFITLQIASSLFHSGLDHYAEETGGGLLMIYQVYQVLPPLGELIFSLKESFSKGVFPGHHLLMWSIWLLISVGLFRLAIRKPRP